MMYIQLVNILETPLRRESLGSSSFLGRQALKTTVDTSAPTSGAPNRSRLGHCHLDESRPGRSCTMGCGATSKTPP